MPGKNRQPKNKKPRNKEIQSSQDLEISEGFKRLNFSVKELAEQNDKLKDVVVATVESAQNTLEKLNKVRAIGEEYLECRQKSLLFTKNCVIYGATLALGVMIGVVSASSNKLKI